MTFVSGSEQCFFLHKIGNFFQSPLFFGELYQNMPLQINVPRWIFKKKNVIVLALLLQTGEYTVIHFKRYLYITQVLTDILSASIICMNKEIILNMCHGLIHHSTELISININNSCLGFREECLEWRKTM